MTRSPSRALFTFRLIPVIAQMLGAKNVDCAALLRESGLPQEALTGEITAPFARIQHFLDLAGAKLQTPTFGLALVEKVPTGAYGVLEFVLRSAPTIERAFAALAEFCALINPMIAIRFTRDTRGGSVRFSVAAQRDVLGRDLNEYTIGFLLREFGSVLGSPLVVERVWFAHGRTEHVDTVARYFGCPIAFQAADCGFVVGADQLARTARTADGPLFEFMLGQARERMARLGNDDVIAKVAGVIEMRLGGGDVSATAIAQAMATTVRSLQRHLTDAGTSFRDVLAHVRRRRRSELQHGGVDDHAIARQLGFSDARAMRRSLDEAD